MTITEDYKITHKLFYLCFGWLLVSANADAQVHSIYLPGNKQLHIADEQYTQEHYQLSEQSALSFLEQNTSATNTQKHYEQDKAGYIATVTALKLKGTHCEEQALAFIEHTANPVYKQRTAYKLAQFYFDNQQLEKAAQYYELAGVANLNNEEVINSKFELAYCYFNSGRFEESEPLLASVRALEGKYYHAGNYYYGLLAYNQNKYEDALKSFETIEHHPDYRNIVPYYIAEIHYFTGKKDKALADAERLIRRSEKTFYHNELHLLAAQVLFEQKNYKEALPYFEYFYNNTERIRKEDLYELAYTYYQLKDWQNAIEYFKQLSNTRDSLAQSSMYLLGDCYLNIKDAKSAKNAFSICADMPFNKKQQEAALFLAAKLSYQLGYNNDAIYNINILLADFPNTVHADEAKTILSELLIRTSNYREAYAALQEVSNKDDAYHRAYQKVAYGYALQQLQKENIVEADKLISESLQHGNDPTYRSAAMFWKSETSYKREQWEVALQYAKDFIQDTRGKEWVEYLTPTANDRNAYMTLGYASMKLEDYEKAQLYFKKARSIPMKYDDSVFTLNASLREADAVFMQKDYEQAIKLYDEVITSGISDSDYAYFQQAIIYGLQGKHRNKEKILTALIERQPPSKYATGARYELGISYIEQNKYSSAINTLLPLTDAVELRNIAPKAWMKIGFAYQQSGNEKKAIDAYRTVAIQYPSSEERPVALDALKSLYIQEGTPEEYARLLKKYDLGADDETALDSTYYATAETQYAAGNWSKAASMMETYLQKYPNGVFLTKANYYKAESYYNLKEYNKALQGYAAVLDGQWSNFSEKSARRAANIAYEKQDYTNAKKYYNMLRNMAMDEASLQTAYNGLMMSNYLQGDQTTAAVYADTILSLPGVEPTIRNSALLFKAREKKATGDLDGALAMFKMLQEAKLGTVAAEARYNIAEVLYLQDKFAEAEEAANNTIQKSGGDEHWVVKSYILLADILTKQEDYFNAKATLQSIVKNCKIVELKKEAETKLAAIIKLEKKETKLSEE